MDFFLFHFVVNNVVYIDIGLYAILPFNFLYNFLLFPSLPIHVNNSSNNSSSHHNELRWKLLWNSPPPTHAAQPPALRLKAAEEKKDQRERIVGVESFSAIGLNGICFTLGDSILCCCIFYVVNVYICVCVRASGPFSTRIYTYTAVLPAIFWALYFTLHHLKT